MNTTIIFILAFVLLLIVVILFFFKQLRPNNDIDEDSIRSICNNEFLFEIVNHLYKLIRNEHSVCEYISIKEPVNKTIYEISKFYTLSSCESNLVLKDIDFVITNAEKTGNLTLVNIALNTKNNFYIYNNISNSIIHGNKSNISGMNIDLIVELYGNPPTKNEKTLVIIHKLFITKNTELSI